MRTMKITSVLSAGLLAAVVVCSGCNRSSTTSAAAPAAPETPTTVGTTLTSAQATGLSDVISLSFGPALVTAQQNASARDVHGNFVPRASASIPPTVTQCTTSGTINLTGNASSTVQSNPLVTDVGGTLSAAFNTCVEFGITIGGTITDTVGVVVTENAAQTSVSLAGDLPGTPSPAMTFSSPAFAIKGSGVNVSCPMTGSVTLNGATIGSNGTSIGGTLSYSLTYCGVTSTGNVPL
ncbi:MAG: hypothetical protein ACHQ49_15735 [Elusimicrobiota bacterium]